MSGASSQNRVRKRAANACVRCRQQKIRCSGSNPCEQCSRRNVSCNFEDGQQKILVSKDFLASLERRAAASGAHVDRLEVISPVHTSGQYDDQHETTSHADQYRLGTQPAPVPAVNREQTYSESEEEPEYDAVPTDAAAHAVNPLISPDTPGYIWDVHGKPYYLGTSSNWAFARRVLTFAHQHVTGEPLPSTGLLFEGSSYDLGWDGQRSITHEDALPLPTADFALYLINTVKFHCGQLFHIFDEESFMRHFSTFHSEYGGQANVPVLWYVHYLVLLAFGKSFVVRKCYGSRPAGADFFVQAMKLLPDVTFLYTDPLHSIEILCCVALYLQCLDLRSSAYVRIGQAMRIAMEHGLHSGVESSHVPEALLQRCREAWWTVYILDRQMSALLGAPMAPCDADITAKMPTFTHSPQNYKALQIRVKLCKSAFVMLQAVYGRGTASKKTFLDNMKESLQTIAEANDDRNKYFPLDLSNSGEGISRLSAHVHLLHHQCIILTTRPLLFSFLQKRLASQSSLHVTSTGGARSLLRVCVASAIQSLDILSTLQSQSLLDTFLPFDLEAAFSSAIVLLISSVVDPSLTRKHQSWLHDAMALLEEIQSRGNLVAGHQKSELQQIDVTLNQLPGSPRSISNPQVHSHQASMDWSIQHAASEANSSQFDFDPLGDWSLDGGMSGGQLMTLADALDFESLLSAAPGIDMF